MNNSPNTCYQIIAQKKHSVNRSRSDGIHSSHFRTKAAEGAQLRTMGIIGGVSWHSTAEYYKLINLRVSQCLGRSHSARLVITSLNFAELLALQREKNSANLVNAFLVEGKKLKSAGCESFMIASHTLSWLGKIIEDEIGLKHMSIYDALVRKLRNINAQRIGLTGTLYTMKDEFYREHYHRAGFSIVTPNEPHLTRIATIVYKELVNGIFLEQSRNAFRECFQDLIRQKVDAVVLGCTEIGMLIKERTWSDQFSPDKISIPLIDLIEAHVTECTEWMLQ